MKSVKQQLEAAESFAKLWAALIPGDLPGMDQFGIWAGSFNGRQIVRGINRAAAKRSRMAVAGTPMTLSDTIAYASSVMRNEAAIQNSFRTVTA